MHVHPVLTTFHCVPYLIEFNQTEVGPDQPILPDQPFLPDQDLLIKCALLEYFERMGQGMDD